MKNGINMIFIYDMNEQDRKYLGQIITRLDRIEDQFGILPRIQEQLKQNEKDHVAFRQEIYALNQNLLDPHEGMWIEVKQNTQFRDQHSETTRWWRTVIGIPVVGIIAKQLWNLFR